MANTDILCATVVDGHYHGHKIKKSNNQKTMGWIRNTASTVQTPCFLFSFIVIFIIYFFLPSFLWYHVSLQQFRDVRQEVAYCLGFDILVSSFPLLLHFSLSPVIPPHYTHPSFPVPECFVSLQHFRGVRDERWHIVSALIHTFDSPNTIFLTVVITSNCRQF